jgi:uncharacterized membrane protein HdeD (DUF308 family)
LNNTIFAIANTIRRFFNRPFAQNCVVVGVILMLIGIVIWKLGDDALGGIVGCLGAILLLVGVALLMAPYNSRRNNKKTVMVYRHEY